MFVDIVLQLNQCSCSIKKIMRHKYTWNQLWQCELQIGWREQYALSTSNRDTLSVNNLKQIMQSPWRQFFIANMS